MKTINRLALAALIALTMPSVAGAQSDKLQNLLSDVKEKTSSSASSGSGIVSNIISGLLGKNKLNEKNLQGTWSYTEPCVVLESDNVLAKIGGDVAMNSVESSLKSFLEGIGFKAGKVALTLESDSTGAMTISGKDIKMNWHVDDSDLVLTILKKDIPINASLSGGNLQLAMSMDKLIDLMEAVLSGVGNISSIGNLLSSMVSKYDGLYMGLKFEKE